MLNYLIVFNYLIFKGKMVILILIYIFVLLVNMWLILLFFWLNLFEVYVKLIFILMEY